MNDLTRLLRYARPHALALALGILLTSLVGMFEAARIALVGPIIDGLAGTNIKFVNHTLITRLLSADHLWATIAVLLVVFTVLKGLAYFFSGYLLTGVGQQIIVRLRQQL